MKPSTEEDDIVAVLAWQAAEVLLAGAVWSPAT